MTGERVLPKRHTSLGWAITEIGFEAVPNYDYEAACEGLSAQAIQTELHRNWLATTEKAIYPEFNPQLHIVDGLVYDPTRPLIVGLDCPGTPAAVITQLDAFGRWCVLHNLSPPEDETIGFYEFFETLADTLLREFAVPHGKVLVRDGSRQPVLDVEFYGDPAGHAKIPVPGQSPKEARSCYEILRDGIRMVIGIDERGREIAEEKPGWGWFVQAGAVDLTAREEAVRGRLTTLLRGGVPAFAVDRSCRTLIEGLSGAHCKKQRSDGRYELDAFKGFHSHTVNALEYPATRLFARKKKEEEDVPRHQVRSRAAARVNGGGGW
jgi:hypothetical protein